MARITPSQAGGANVCAFLDMIAWSELGPGLMTPATDDGYRVLVGSTTAHPLLFTSYARHPNVFNRAMNSHAAGRDQFMPATWNGLVAKLGLTDFSPLNQDRGCIELLRECRAYPQIVGGNTETAIHLARSIWASLPGAGYGQHENRVTDLLTADRAALAKQRPDFTNVEGGVNTTAGALLAYQVALAKQRPDFSNVQSGAETWPK